MNMKAIYEIPKLYGLFKNGKVAKFSDDIDNLFATWSKLRDDGHEYEVRLVAKNIKQNVYGSNEQPAKMFNADGTHRRDLQISAAIGDAFERAGIQHNEVDWTSDWEWKTQKRIDKINGMD